MSRVVVRTGGAVIKVRIDNREPQSIIFLEKFFFHVS